MTKALVISGILLVNFINAVLAQNPEKEATRLFEAGYYAAAIPFFENALARDTSLQLLEQIAYAHYKSKNFSAAEKFYMAAFQVPYYSETTPYYLGESLRSLGRYEDAKYYFELCKYYPSANAQALQIKIASCDFSRKNSSNKISLEIFPAKEINTPQSDCVGPIMGDAIYFSSDRKSSGNTIADPVSGGYAYRIFSIGYDNKDGVKPKFGRAKMFDSGLLGENYHMAFPNFSDGNKTLFYVAVPKVKSRGYSLPSTIISASSRNGKKFDVNFEQYFSGIDLHSNIHPCVIASANLLIFSSNREGGYGGFDLYALDLSKGNEAEPFNLGKEINSAGDELFPSYFDGQLYFSSDGKIGWGGLDIYRSSFIGKQKFGKAELLFAPINSSNDDFSMQFSSDRKLGFFSSNRLGGKGQDDIYYFYLDKKTEIKHLSSSN